jgi:glutamyl-Q tRNA(Asp) synthetase
MPVTRFAPSPTGYLHLGHAYSALFAARAAENGRFLLRIEDIDPIRCKPEYTKAIFEDLHWLGLKWPEPVRCQSKHLSDYTEALEKLKEKGLIYPCFCTRRDIEQEAQKSGLAPHRTDGGFIYPGTCKNLSSHERVEKLKTFKAVNWRLDATAALSLTGPLFWHDRVRGKINVNPNVLGDVVLARKDVPTSYHLSVTVDDHIQGVTLVTRSEDLFDSTHMHRLLQASLGFESLEYQHHKLLTDQSGQRYAKRDKSATLRALRESGKSSDELIRIIDLIE